MAETREELSSEALEEILRPDKLDSEWLVRLGKYLDRPIAGQAGLTVGTAAAEMYLQVRTRGGRTAPLRANPVQQEFERRRGTAEHCAEGAADGADDVGGGAVLS